MMRVNHHVFFSALMTIMHIIILHAFMNDFWEMCDSYVFDHKLSAKYLSMGTSGAWVTCVCS